VIGILKEHLIIFTASLSLEPSLILDTWRSYTIDIKVSNEGENIETPIAFKIIIIASNQLIISHKHNIQWLGKHGKRIENAMIVLHV
jgi:hypothetical protein